jgi:hypothetical protein
MSMVKKRRGLRLIITIEIITNIRKLDMRVSGKKARRWGSICGDCGD